VLTGKYLLDISDATTVSILRAIQEHPWQQDPPKCCELITNLPGIISQQTFIFITNTVKKKLKSCNQTLVKVKHLKEASYGSVQIMR
jgi:hypothetical protein